MQQTQREVILLKPTPAFWHLLKAYLPKSFYPDFDMLHVDVTAYTFMAYDSDQELIKAIERHHNEMFKYELERWLGVGKAKHLKSSFFDFTCCFKFEALPQVFHLNSPVTQGNFLFQIKPGIAVVASFDNAEDVMPFIEQHFPQGLDMELHSHLVHMKNE